MNKNDIHSDCKYFFGHIPCAPHKRAGVHCVDCREYEPQDKHILIIKLGAIGDVIRTTPLLRRLKEEYPKARIYWLTYSPEVLPAFVDVPLRYTVQDIAYLQAIEFDLLLNLDKDREACALGSLFRAKTKRGFSLVKGKTAPIDDAASHKFLTGIFDDRNKANKKNYLEEIFEICGYQYHGEEYILELPQQEKPITRNIDHAKVVIGLNTGCGERWTSRLWATEYWIELAQLLKKEGKEVILLGGQAEHEKNMLIASKSEAKYYGHFSLKDFFYLVNECDVLVTAVTMALHVGIGLRKKIVLFNNIFNRNEFELFNRGVILEPEKECRCYFSPRCSNTEYFCMEHLSVKSVLEGVETALKVLTPS
jgi:ADP-heptose:LPS heptosyltransferase